MFLFQEKSRWFREKPFFCLERCVIFGIKKKKQDFANDFAKSCLG